MSSASIDLLGHLASALVLATFCAQDILPLRAPAITGNLAFIAYAVLARLNPVLLLHALLPTPTYRLAQGGRGSATPPTPKENHHDAVHPELRARIE